MKTQTKSGIRLYFLIEYHELFDFLEGKRVFDWPTLPVVDPNDREREKKECYPFGRTQVRVDPAQVEIDNFAAGVYLLQWVTGRGTKKRPAKKLAGQRRRRENLLKTPLEGGQILSPL